MLILPLILAIFLPKTLGISSCPAQCFCTDGDIVCTCESTSSGELSINSLGGSFVRSFVVHSCTKVDIQNGSFSGVVLQERLTLVAIGRLIIEPGAFKGIIQSPKQIVIEQCNIPRLLSGAFEGLSRLQHIWFKKCQLDTIETGAFSALGPLDYLYFRDCSIGYLQEQSFGQIRHIQHLFFRGGMKIASSEAKIFGNSSINELVLDDVVAHLHEAFLLDIQAPVVINNSSMHFTSRGETLSASAASSPSLIVSESRLNNFSPLLNYHFHKIEILKSKIKRVKAPDSQILGYLPPVLRLFIEESDIISFDSLSLAHTKIAEVKIRDSRVGNVSQAAFSGSKISKITVENSRLGEIQTGAFSDAKIEKISFEGSRITRFATKSLERSTIRRLELKKVEIRHLGDAVFSDIHNLTVIEAKIPVTEAKPFKNSKITYASFDRCDFQGTMKRSFLDGLNPIKLTITESRFDCNSGDCELNSMLFSPIREDILWKFEHNSCGSNKTTGQVCMESTSTDFGSLQCQKSAFVADCVCTGGSARLPAFDVQVLIIGDCDEIILDDPTAPSPTVLYLYRIGKSEFYHAPRGLRAVNIYHSNVILRPGFGASKNFDRFWLEKSRLYLEDGALNHGQIASFRLDHSRLQGLSPVSLEGTVIEQLTINGSRLETAAALLHRTSRLSLVDSVLGSSEGLAAVRFAHLANNTILCCCEQANSMSLRPARLENRVSGPHFEKTSIPPCLSQRAEQDGIKNFSASQDILGPMSQNTLADDFT